MASTDGWPPLEPRDVEFRIQYRLHEKDDWAHLTTVLRRDNPELAHMLLDDKRLERIGGMNVQYRAVRRVVFEQVMPW